MSKNYQPRVVADRIVEDEATSDLVTRLEAEADRDIAANLGPAGVVTLRWVKQVVFKQAVADIEQSQRALSPT
jgi:hypothetical protein